MHALGEAMTKQTLAEYAEQKIAKANIDEAKDEVLRDMMVLLELCVPLEFAIDSYRRFADEKIAAGELTKESVFLVECWIREAYEKAEKG